MKRSSDSPACAAAHEWLRPNDCSQRWASLPHGDKGDLTVRRNLVGLIWLAGIVLAVLVYQAGPDRIVYAAADAIDAVRAAFDNILAAFAVNTFEVMRALTIGLVPAFVALCAVAHHRGQRVLWTLVTVALAILVLLYRPLRDGEIISSFRWTVAFLVVGVASLNVTRRLSEAPRWRGGMRDGPWRQGRDASDLPPSRMP